MKILTEARFRIECKQVTDKYKVLRDDSPEDENFQKLGKVYQQMKMLYFSDIANSVKRLKLLKDNQTHFSAEKKEVVMQTIEVLQNFITHKNLEKEETENPSRKMKKGLSKKKR